MTTTRFVELADAAPDQAVVVVDVLRAFTFVPWVFAKGASRVVATDTREAAIRLRAEHLPGSLLAGEHGGRPFDGFDLGNSPTQASRHPGLAGATIVHRTSAGTQGLVRTIGSDRVFAASLVTAGATARALRALAPGRVTFVITGASLGRDGDEDLAAAELIAARMVGEDPSLDPVLARVAASTAGRMFTHDGPDWAPPSDLALACEVDRFAHSLVAEPVQDLIATDGDGLLAVEVRPA